MFPGYALKRANPAGYFNGVGPAVPAGKPLHAVAPDLRGIAFLLHPAEHGGDPSTQHPAGQSRRLDRDGNGFLFQFFLHLYPPSFNLFFHHRAVSSACWRGVMSKAFAACST